MSDETDLPPIPAELLKGLRRESLARHDLTLEYLEAGVQLIEDTLDHPPESGVHPFLSWLSQRAVVRSVNQRGRLHGSLATIRDRWEPHANYVDDLVAWLRYRRPSRSFATREEERVNRATTGRASISQAVRGLSREIQRGIIENPLFRLQLVVLAVLGSPRYRASSAYLGGVPDLYSEIDQRWLPLIHQFMTSRQLCLRPGMEEQDLVEILVAVGEGIALRELADPTRDPRRSRRLRHQGTAVLALIYACTVPLGDSAETLEDAVDERT